MRSSSLLWLGIHLSFLCKLSLSNAGLSNSTIRRSAARVSSVALGLGISSPQFTAASAIVCWRLLHRRSFGQKPKILQISWSAKRGNVFPSRGHCRSAAPTDCCAWPSANRHRENMQHFLTVNQVSALSFGASTFRCSTPSPCIHPSTFIGRTPIPGLSIFSPPLPLILLSNGR